MRVEEWDMTIGIVRKQQRERKLSINMKSGLKPMEAFLGLSTEQKPRIMTTLCQAEEVKKQGRHPRRW